jgi:Mg-chelatase subunit ChlD
VITFSGEGQKEARATQEIEEAKGKLTSDFSDEKLMHSVLEADKDTIDDGRLIADSINQGVGSFTPDMIYQSMVKNYSLAEQILGESIIRELSGYDASYVKENVHIPEFKRELEKKIGQRVEELKEKGLIERDGSVSGKGYELAALILYVDELHNLVPRGMFGNRVRKRGTSHGDREDVVEYTGQRYRDIAIRDTLKVTLRRGRERIEESDLRAFDIRSRGQIYIVYALDASGSMRGKKIEQCKKAGIALAYKAIEEKDKVGLIVFGEKIKEKIAPTTDFVRILKAITGVSASNETNISETIVEAIGLFPRTGATKHLMIITDAVPTKGRRPEEATLEAVSLARSNGITISIIGIKLDARGERIAKRIAATGAGRLYRVADLEDMDRIVLEDYYKETG